MNQKLKCFLYMLMREELPCGIVARIMKKINKLEKGTIIQYSNKGLAEYAGEITQELIHKELNKKWVKEKAGILHKMIKLNPEFAIEKAEDFIGSLLEQMEIQT